MTMLHVFGDSWAAEVNEPEFLYQSGKTNVKPQTLASLIAQQCDLEYRCHAVNGSSQAGMFRQLEQSNISANDVGVFFLTSPSRRTYFTDQGESRTLPVDLQPQYVNDYHCFAMQEFCIKNHAHPLFVSTFNVNYVELNSLWNHVDRQYWMLPPDTCVVRELFDPIWFQQYDVYRNSDFFDWLKSDVDGVQKFIRPCQGHPNMQGRLAMATLAATFIKKIIK
jgi:hypothetical protein